MNRFEKAKKFFKYDEFKGFISKYFTKFFGFEIGINITNKLEVLNRKNIVIKHIILLLNLAYFILMLIITLSGLSQNGKENNYLNIIITVSTLPITLMINFFLSKLIKPSKKESEDSQITKQQVALYFIVAYLFISVLLFYLKVTINPILYDAGKIYPKGNALKFEKDLEPFAYILFYVALTIIALYQDKKVLLNSSIVMFVILTFIHFFLTNKTYSVESPKFLVDILLRTLVFLMFVIVLYAYVSISQYIQDERVKEMKDKKEIHDSFLKNSSDLFSVVLSSKKQLVNKEHIEMVLRIAQELAKKAGFDQNNINKLSDYCLCILDTKILSNLTDYNFIQSLDLKDLQKQANKGSIIAKRLQLAQKCEEIARASEEERITKEFIQIQNEIQKNKFSQVLLLSDLYVTMRSANSYKRPISHLNVIDRFDKQLKYFVQSSLYERFKDFNQVFEKLYDNF